MKKELNISEILKGKPKGIKLYSPIFGECTFSFIQGVTDAICVIANDNREFFDYKGLYSPTGEHLLFPSKLMRNWLKFSWKKGDVLVSNDGGTGVIFDKWYDETYTSFYCKHYLDSEDENNIKYNEAFLCTTERYSLEDKDSVQIYINTIEERLGGKLNRETLEVEKYQLEFKDGDIVVAEEDNYYDKVIFIAAIKDDIVSKALINVRYEDYEVHYNEYRFGRNRSLRLATDSEKQQLFDALLKKNKAWDAEKKQIVDLKPKWTPKPFDRVITRNAADDVWTANIFSHMDSHGEYVTIACVGGYTHCLPYNEETAKLIGTTKDVGKYAVYDSHLREYPFSSDSYEECEKWIEEHGNDIDMCVIP